MAGAVALVAVGHELTATRPFHAAIVEIGIVLFLAWTMGAAMGTPLTYVHELARQQHLELRTTSGRARELAGQPSVYQRVLRHNLRNDLDVVIGALDEWPVEEGTTPPRWTRDAIASATTSPLETAEESLLIRRVLEEDDRVPLDLVDVVRGVVTRPVASTRPGTSGVTIRGATRISTSPSSRYVGPSHRPTCRLGRGAGRTTPLSTSTRCEVRGHQGHPGTASHDLRWPSCVPSGRPTRGSPPRGSSRSAVCS